MKISTLLICCLFFSACAPRSGGRATPPHLVYPEDRREEGVSCGSLTGEACGILQDTNFQRRKNGLGLLHVSELCRRVAEAHALDMAKNSFFSNSSPHYGTFAERARREGLSGYAGENLARGFSPDLVVSFWMNSIDHRTNLLDPRYRSMGVAVALDRAGLIYVAQCLTEELD